jgi:cyclic 2,3-diphosphoglycerate synthetase
VRAIALVDGEHYPDVVRHALAELAYTVVAVVLVGGTEKLRGVPEYGVPVETDVEAAIAEHRPDVVVDLSDEPVLGPERRLLLASRVLASGVPYAGPGFRFDPPPLADVAAPTLAVVGTGKRVGKTAVTGHLARTLSRDRRVVVVAMGRGGPAQPETILAPPTLETLLALSRQGRHAASDHLETAAVAGVPTVGCRRCGGGLAGEVAVSNVLDGVEVALGHDPDLLVLDGSGAALPPVASGRRILVVGANQPPTVSTGYLNAYRLLLADLVVVTMAEGDQPHAEVARRCREIVRPGVPVVRAVLRPRTLAPIAGRRVALFCTAPPSEHARLRAHLESLGAERVTVSGNLAHREALAAELDVEADVFAVELKGAAVDVVAEAAVARGRELVLVANDVVPLPGEPALDAELRRLADEAARVVGATA